MSRRINTVTFQAANGTSTHQGDSYTDRILKLIPGDVVAGWLAVTSAAKAEPKLSSEGLLWAVFAGGLVFAAAWTWKQSSEPGKAKPYTQTAVSTGAFFVWAYATGGVAPAWPGSIYNALVGTVLIVGFTLLSGLVTNP